MQAAGLRAQLEDADVARVVDVERRGGEALGRLDDLRPAVGADASLAQVVAVQLRLRGDEALRELGLRHLEREERDRLVEVDRGVLRDVGDERALSHRRARGEDDQVAGLEAAGELVDVVEAGRGAGDRHPLARDQLELVELVVEDVLDRAQLAGAVLVGDPEERALRLLEQLVGGARGS